MKAIHTSDWHLGQVFYGMERTEEHLYFLEQLCDVIRMERPDVLLISGDVYDSVVPSITTQKLYNTMLFKIRETSPEMKIIVTAGNHDSSSRLELNSELWNAFNVKIIGNIEKDESCMVDFDRHIVEIVDSTGNKCGYVIAVPYVYRANYPASENNEDSRMYSFHQTLLDRVLCMNDKRLPIIMMGHLAVSGADAKGHEMSRMRLVYEPLSELGNGYDYLALGHIHRPQKVNESGSVRYSGSPIQLNFDEDYKHSVYVVEIEEHGQVPVVKKTEMKPLIPLYTIPKNGGNIDEVLKCISELPDEKTYVRVRLNVKDVVPMQERISIESAFKQTKACFCELQPIRDFIEEKRQTVFFSDEMHNISPMEIASDFYRQRFGCEMDKELSDLLSESIRMAEKENKEDAV